MNRMDLELLNNIEVYLIDDSPISLKLISELLNKFNCKVRTFNSANEALQLLNDKNVSKPDVIITDYEMPSMNGVDFIKILRQIPEIPWIPTLILTSHSIPELLISAVASGADAFASKGSISDAIVAQLLALVRSSRHVKKLKAKEIDLIDLFEKTQELAKIGCWTFDCKTYQIEWSRKLFDLFPEKIENGPPTFERLIETIHPDDVGLWKTSVEKCMSEGIPYQIRHRSIFPNGKFLWIEAIGAAKRDLSGEIISLSGTAQDISERVESEDKIKSERSKAVHNAKLASLGEMSAGIAHEINNPLAIIIGMTWGLFEARNDEIKLKSMIDSVVKSADRIEKIVYGLKKFSRSSSYKQFQKNSLDKIIDESIILTSARANRVFVDIDFEIKTDSSKLILCDEIEIEQVFINLINNGVDEAKTSVDKKVKIILFKDDSELVVHVIDSGFGVSIENQTKLFEPFFTTKEVGVGTGLGLSITKGILDEHDAKIQLLTSEKKTTFEVRFKLVS